jgi:AraC-like DNA-binding protein
VKKARAAALTNYIEVAESLGLDADAMLATVGLDRDIIADPDRMVVGESMSRLLDLSAAASGCAAFGLLMAESRPISGLGALSLLFRHQRTLRDAIHVLVRYQHVLGDTVFIALEEDAATETALIRIDILATHRFTRQPIELTVGEMGRAFGRITGGEWRPESAHFVHQAPDDLSIHQRVLGCPVVFGSTFNGLTCTPAALEVPLAGAEPEVARYAEDSVERLARARAEGTLVDRVRRALHVHLPSGQGTLERVGSDLGLHPRAVQRGLAERGTSFGQVLNQVRREVAQRHLATSTLSIEAVATLVGYATLSSFSRWFTAEFGIAANVWRSAMSAPPAP